MNTEAKQPRWFIFIALTLIQAVGALIWLLSIPSEQSSAIALGFSPLRLLLASVPFAVALAAAATLVLLGRSTQFLRRANQWGQKLRSSHLLKNLYAGCSAVLLSAFAVTLGSEINQAVFQRLLPLLCLGALLWLEFGVFFILPVKTPFRLPIEFTVSIGFVGICVLLAVLADPAAILELPYYSGSGSPVLPYQLLLTLSTLIIAMALIQPARQTRWQALVLPVLLFLLAAVMWSATPIPGNHFAHTSNLPGNDLFPYSDSRAYDGNAQQMLLGQGLAGGHALPRPLYSFFVGWLHVLLGESLIAVLDVQTVILALIPAGIYLLGKRMFHPAAGLAAALLFIFRETNQALLSAEYTLVSVRMLMSEPFMVASLVAFSLSAAKWADRIESRPRALYAGALLGVSVLVRTQALLLGGAIVAFLLLKFSKDLRKSVAPLLLFLLGLVLVITPWAVRNFYTYGRFAIDDRNFSRYIPDTFTNASFSAESIPDSIDFVPSSELSPDTADPAQAQAWNFGRGLFGHTISLFTNNNLSALYQLPWKWNINQPLEEYVANEIDAPLLGNAQFTRTQIIILLVHLLVLTIGLAGAWKKNRFAGLLPAAIYLSYNLSSVAASYSGWRFIQPVDWILLLYWAIGFTACASHFLAPSPPAASEADTLAPKQERTSHFTWAVVAALVLGLLMPVGERIFPKQEPPDRAALIAQIEQHVLSPNTQKVLSLALNPESSIASGVLLYPQLLVTERDYLLNGVSGLWPNGIPLLTFNVVSDQVKWYHAPNFVQTMQVEHHMPVIVVGCEGTSNTRRWLPPTERNTQRWPRAIAILVQTEQPYWLYVSQSIPESCDSILGD